MKFALKYQLSWLSQIGLIVMIICCGNLDAQEVNCFDGIDNDGDGLVDCADPDVALKNCCSSCDKNDVGISNSGDTTWQLVNAEAGYDRALAIRYTQRDQFFTVPNGVQSLKFKIWGAAGGIEQGWGNVNPNRNAGAGGYTEAILPVTAGQRLLVVVGEGGKITYSTPFSSYGAGGFDRYDGGGGGLSGVFNSNSFSNATQSNAYIIAGGGGGASTNSTSSGGSNSGGNGNSPFSGGMPYFLGSSDFNNTETGSGGGGYHGGILHEREMADGKNLGDAGNGGSGFITPSATSGNILYTTEFNPNPPRRNDIHYVTGIGQAKKYVDIKGRNGRGGNGMIIIQWKYESTTKTVDSIYECQTNSSLNLFNQLSNSTLSNNGIWIDENADSIGTGNSFLTSLTTVGEFKYSYINSPAECTSDTSTLYLFIEKPLYAGNDKVIEICDNDIITLFDSLSGNPDSTGYWTGPSQISNGIFNTAINSNGIYNYIVTSSSCPNDTSTVNINTKTSTPSKIMGDSIICQNQRTVIFSSNQAGNWSSSCVNCINSNSGLFETAVASSNEFIYFTPTEWCIESDTILLQILDTADLQLTISEPVACINDSSVFSVSSNGVIDSIFWNLGDSNVSTLKDFKHQYSNAKCYDIDISAVNSNGCKSTRIMNSGICILEKPTASFQIVEGSISDQYIFNNQSENFTGNDWTINDDIYLYGTDERYIFDEELSVNSICLIVTNQSICSDTICDTVSVNKTAQIYTPNSFSPNNDGRNDQFNPQFSNPDLVDFYELTIYDRWGVELFKSFDFNFGWNGKTNDKVYSTGVYVWKIKYRFSDNPEIQVAYGSVSLLK